MKNSIFFLPSYFFFFPRNCSASGSFNIVQIPLHTGAVSSRSRVDKVRNNSAPADSAQFCNAVLTLTTKTGARRRLLLLRHRTVCESWRALKLAGECTNIRNNDFFDESEISISLMKHVCSFWLKKDPIISYLYTLCLTGHSRSLLKIIWFLSRLRPPDACHHPVVSGDDAKASSESSGYIFSREKHSLPYFVFILMQNLHATTATTAAPTLIC